MNTDPRDIEKEIISITTQLLEESGEPHKKNIQLNDSLQGLGIDSLGRAELFGRLEKTFQVSFPDAFLGEVRTLNDLANFVIDKPEKNATSYHPSRVLHTERIALDPLSAQSLMDVLLLYATHAKDKPHIYFYNENNQEEIITYQKLLEESLKVAQGLRHYGLLEGETVAIMQPTCPQFFYVFFGTLFAGGVPVPIYPPFRMHMLETYARVEARILQNANVRFLITFTQAEKLSHLLKAFVPSLKRVFTPDELTRFGELKNYFLTDANHFAMIQYTSGSTSDPKGILLTHYNLLTNVRSYGKTIKIVDSDVAVSWLPLYHDLGLIGMWLGSLYHGVPLILLTPFTFLNHPDRWLWTIHYHRGTISGAPNFAYELCLKKIEPHQLEGLDLSSWRIAANGAEKVYPSTLEGFAKKFAPFGFRKEALLPVYGLAESTVGLLIPPINRAFKIDHVDRYQFEEKLFAEPKEGTNTLSFVSCGVPMEGHFVKIVNEAGDTLPERNVGRLFFKGPSNMQGYYNNPEATKAICHDGWIDSGDRAYQAEGEFYIIGRQKDLIIKAGRNIYPAELEEMVGQVKGVRQGCVVAFGDQDVEKGTEALIIVAETRVKEVAAREEIIETIKSVITENLDIVPDHIALVVPHSIPKTSSGKLQRAACKKMYKTGTLSGKSPPWVQLMRLSFDWLYHSTKRLIGRFCQILFTIYVALVFLLTFTPLYFIARFTSQKFTARCTHIWARWMCRFVFCPLTVVFPENRDKVTPVIYAANHASYVDAIVLMGLLPPNTRFVGKKELFAAPFIKTFMHKLGYLSVDRIDLSKSVVETERIKDVLKGGNPIMIFPEGTFSYAPGLRPFRLGAFKTSVDTGVAICPIALKGTRHVLRDDERLMWPGKVTITFCEPVSPRGQEWLDVTQLRNAVRQEIAKYCGEAPLDYIAAEHVAKKFV